MGLAKTCLRDAIAWAPERHFLENHSFSGKLSTQNSGYENENPRHRSIFRKHYLENGAKDVPVVDVCLLKNQATQTLEYCAKEAVQILGGMGYSRGTKVERIYRETKVLSIGGGAEEIMKELAAKQMGL